MKEVKNSKIKSQKHEKPQIVRKWKILRRNKVFENRNTRVYDDKVVFPNGKIGRFSYISRKNGVAVIAFDGRHVHLVNQYRYTLKKRFWETVAGKTRSRRPFVQAKQELKEETGFLAKKWTCLGKFACGPGHTTQIGTVFLAENLFAGEPRREAPEADMYVKKFKISEVDKMIEQEKIIDSWTIVPWYFFKQYLARKKR